MADIARLVIEVDSKGVPKANARVMRLTSTAKKNETATKKMAGAWRSYGRILAGIGIGIVMRQMIRAVSEGQKALAQLEAGLASTAGTSGQTIESLVALSNEMQRTTAFADDMVQSAEAVLLTFTKISGETFPRTIRAAADLSTRMGTDLQSSIVQLGKALNDPIQNLSALSRAGIQFDPVQKTLIKQLWETNRAAEAQAIILDELETQFGQSAEKYRETLGGAIDNLNNSWSDFLERLGKDPSPALKGAADAISSFFTDIDDWMTTSIFTLSRGWLRHKFAAMSAWEAMEFAWETTTVNIINTWNSSLKKILGFTSEALKTIDEGFVKANTRFAKAGKVVLGALSPALLALKSVFDEFTEAGEGAEDALTPLERLIRKLDDATVRYNGNLTVNGSLEERLATVAEERSAAIKALNEAEERRFDDLDKRYKSSGKGARDAAQASAEASTQITELFRQGSLGAEVYGEGLDILGEKLKNAIPEKEDAEGMSAWAKEMQSLTLTFGTSFIDTLFDAERRAELTFESVASGFAKMVARMLAQQALLHALNLGSIFGPVRAAKGAAFSAGRVTPMARGGVVTQPTLFPMARGAGLMGEAGPEAVMPLTRTSSGELGVKAEGAGAEVHVNIINNTGARVTQQRRQSGQRTELSIIVGDAMEQHIKDGRLDRAMDSSFDLKRVGGR